MKHYWVRCIIKGNIWVKYITAFNIFGVAAQLHSLDPNVEIKMFYPRDDYDE